MGTELYGNDRATHDRARDGFDRISAALRGLRYGTVTAVVQDDVGYLWGGVGE